MTERRTAARSVERLHEHASDDERRRIQRYFKTGEGEYAEGELFLGVRMGQVSALARALLDLPLSEIEVLLDDRNLTKPAEPSGCVTACGDLGAPLRRSDPRAGARRSAPYGQGRLRIRRCWLSGDDPVSARRHGSA